MTTYVLYTKSSESQGVAERFARELEGLRVSVRLMDADSREGVALTEHYDLLARPAVIVLQDDGGMIGSWSGELPAASEVSYLAHR